MADLNHRKATQPRMPARRVEKSGRGFHVSPRIILALVLSAVAGAVLAVYRPVLSAQAISFDDANYLFENPLFHQPGWYPITRFFGEVLESTTIEGYYEPLTLTSLLADVARGGRPDNLRPFHETSLALHVLNTAMILVLLYQLFGRVWVAAFAALLFGLHPLTVEPVAWVWERKTLLAAAFALGSLITYVCYVQRRSRVAHAASLTLFVLSLLAKPTGIPLPFLLLLLDYWPLQRLGKRALIEMAPYFIISGVFAAITIISTQRNAVLTLPGERSLLTIPVQIAWLLAFYLGKIHWPSNLTSAYSPPRPAALSNPLVLAGVLVTTALIAALIVSWRRTRAPITGALFFVVAIAPTLGLIGYSWVIASDKYVYLPAIGLLLIVAWALDRLAQGSSLRAFVSARPITGFAVLIVVLAIAGAEALGTRRYLAVWRNTETLYRHMVRVSPDMPGPHNNLAGVLLDKGDIPEAIDQAREALRLDPRHVGAFLNLGNALIREGRIEEAIDAYQSALVVNPKYARGHNNLGLALYRTGRTEQAIEHYNRAIELQPEYAEAWCNRGAALLRLQRFEQAAESFRAALRWRPDSGEAHLGMGSALASLGQGQVAREQYQEALRLNPKLAEAHLRLAALNAREGHLDAALRHYRMTLQLQPDSLAALNNLAWILATHPDPAVRNGAESLQLAERACRAVEPPDASTLDTLAAAYAETQDFPRAIETIHLAMRRAREGQNHPLPEDLTARLKRYEAGFPHREQR